MLPTVFTSPSTAPSANRIDAAVVTSGSARNRSTASVEKPVKPSDFTT